MRRHMISWWCRILNYVGRDLRLSSWRTECSVINFSKTRRVPVLKYFHGFSVSKFLYKFQINFCIKIIMVPISGWWKIRLSFWRAKCSVINFFIKALRVPEKTRLEILSSTFCIKIMISWRCRLLNYVRCDSWLSFWQAECSVINFLLRFYEFPKRSVFKYYHGLSVSKWSKAWLMAVSIIEWCRTWFAIKLLECSP